MYRIGIKFDLMRPITEASWVVLLLLIFIYYANIQQVQDGGGRHLEFRFGP